jgi:hypothetical protein
MFRQGERKGKSKARETRQVRQGEKEGKSKARAVSEQGKQEPL